MLNESSSVEKQLNDVIEGWVAGLCRCGINEGYSHGLTCATWSIGDDDIETLKRRFAALMVAWYGEAATG